MFGQLEDEKYALARQCALATPNLSLLGFDKAIIGRNLGNWVSDDIDALPLPPGVLVKSGDEITLRLGDFAALGALLRGLAGAGAADDEA